MQTIIDVKTKFCKKLKDKEFVIDKTGVKTIEALGESFKVLPNDTRIFGTPNDEYINRELAWYESQSLSVNDIPPPIPQVWKAVADKDGLINSNYGFLIFSNENFNQFQHVVEELKTNKFSRRAQMIYTRPSIWNEYNKNGMSDFICTDSVQYFIRGDMLIANVRMRSNDLVYGFKNDLAWQKYVLEKLSNELSIDIGYLIWTVGSAHVYERHFHLITME